MPRLSTAQLARCCPAAFVPLGHWPVRWHGALWAVTLGVLLVAVGGVHRWQWRTQQHIEQQLQEASQRPRSIASTRPATSTVSPSARGDDVALAAMQAELAASAQRHQLMLSSLQFAQQRGSDAGDAGLVLRIHGQLQGPYPALKAWVSELMARYEWLALHSIALRRAEAGGDRLEASVAFDAYLAPHR